MDIELPNGVIIEGVPEGTSKDEVMRKAISMGLAKEADFAEPVTQQQIESDVPMPPEEVSALSPEQQAEYFGTQERPERTIAERIGGGVEAGASAVSGMTSGLAAGALGGLYGIGRSVVEGTYGTPEAAQEAARTSERWANAATIKPVTEAGQEAAQAVAEVLGPVGQVATALSPMATSGLGAMTRAAMPQVETMAQRAAMNVPRFERAKISQVRQALKENTTESVGWKLKGDKPVPNMLERDLLDANIKDKTIIGLRDLGKNHQSLALKTLDLVEDSVLGREGSDFNRASMVAGERVMRRFEKLSDIQKQASTKIANAVKKDLRGKKVDVSDMLNQYVERVQDLGGTFDESGQLRLRPMSSLLPSDARLLREGYQSLKKGIFDAAELHNKKMDWSARIYGAETSSPVKLSPKAKELLTSVRGQMNSRLREISKDYAMANDEFSSAIRPLQGFAEAVGKKRFNEILGSELDMESTRISNFTGDQLRKVFSNYSNANQLISAVDELNNVANSFPGKKFGNEIVPLVRLNTNLESVFGADPATLKGITQDVASMAPGRVGGMIETGKAAYEAIKKRTSAFDAPAADKRELINKLREQVKAQ